MLLAAITGCSKISRIKNSISGDKFTEIAEDYGLEVGKKENSSITTYIAQGNDIYAEFYVFDKNSYVSTSYQYITGNIESAFEDITAETETRDDGVSEISDEGGFSECCCFGNRKYHGICLFHISVGNR